MADSGFSARFFINLCLNVAPDAQTNMCSQFNILTEGLRHVLFGVDSEESAQCVGSFARSLFEWVTDLLQMSQASFSEIVYARWAFHRHFYEDPYGSSVEFINQATLNKALMKWEGRFLKSVLGIPLRSSFLSG